jgi:hypothetical protein
MLTDTDSSLTEYASFTPRQVVFMVSTFPIRMIILTAKQYHNHPSPGPDSPSPPKNSFILIPVDTRKLDMRFILPKHELLEHPAASHPTTDHSAFTDDPQHNTNAEFLNDRNVDNVRDSEVDNKVGGEVGVAAWVETTRCYMYLVIDMYSISIQHCYITESSKWTTTVSLQLLYSNYRRLPEGYYIP